MKTKEHVNVVEARKASMRYEAQFSDLRAALEGVHAYLRQCVAQCVAGSEPHSEHVEALHRLRLVAHEWVANLVRHARFGERRPEVRVRIWRHEARLRCTIEDNSQGFDLAAHLDEQPDLAVYARSLPDGGMGLLLLKTGTERVEYASQEGPWNCLHLSVNAGRC